MKAGEPTTDLETLLENSIEVERRLRGLSALAWWLLFRHTYRVVGTAAMPWRPSFHDHSAQYGPIDVGQMAHTAS